MLKTFILNYALGVKQYGSSPYCILSSSVLQYIAILQYRTCSKFRGLNFRVAPSNCICGSLSSWGTNFRGQSWGGFARYLATCGLIFVDKEYTTKSMKIYAPRKFLRVRYMTRLC